VEVLLDVCPGEPAAAPSHCPFDLLDPSDGLVLGGRAGRRVRDDLCDDRCRCDHHCGGDDEHHGVTGVRD
jgi:hypothetical protein